MRSLLAAGLIGLLAATGRGAPDGPREFGVRTVVTDPAGLASHGKVYAILSVQMFSSEPGAMARADEDALMAAVCHALDTHGFRPVVKGQSPEVLITVHYGHAWLRNPYLSENGNTPATEGISSVAGLHNLPNQDITGATNPLMEELSAGYESRVQKAAAEKLYLRLTGWKYPPDPKAKAERLWQTTVLVDDPGRWNFNATAGDMLKAGAPFFDREIAGKELELRAPEPVAHVNVGVAELVEPTAAKSAAAPPGGASKSVPTATGKKFALPAGDADLTLQLFSQQSGEEIIYPVEQIHGVKTHAVHGEMSARAALDRMLDGTGLIAVQDERSDALAIRPSTRPQ